MSVWQPIETAPGQQVLLYYPAIIHPHRGQTHSPWFTVGYAGATPRKATHWMPLPPAPEVSHVG